VMAKRTDQRLATVPFGATPAGQPPSVKEWANRTVWNERMLDALQCGVRGGKWHTLIDKVLSPLSLDRIHGLGQLDSWAAAQHPA
jgi:hypothetical protein